MELSEERNARVFIQYGEAFHTQGNFEEARKSYREAAALYMKLVKHYKGINEQRKVSQFFPLAEYAVKKCEELGILCKEKKKEDTPTRNNCTEDFPVIEEKFPIPHPNNEKEKNDFNTIIERTPHTKKEEIPPKNVHQNISSQRKENKKKKETPFIIENIKKKKKTDSSSNNRKKVSSPARVSRPKRILKKNDKTPSYARKTKSNENKKKANIRHFQHHKKKKKLQNYNYNYNNNSSKKKKKKEKEIVVPHPESDFTRACCEGEKKKLKLFLKEHEHWSIDESDYRFGLHFSAYHHHFEICKTLIKTGKFDANIEYEGMKLMEYVKDDTMKLALRVFFLLQKELAPIIGLASVKHHLYSLANKIILDKKREKMGRKISSQTHDMIFTGNPGTGKTSIASVICKMYHLFGIISKETLKTVQRSELVAGHIGQTAIKTRNVIDSCKGGILFIDEAYRLSQEKGKDFGREAVEEIMQCMNRTASKESVIFIFAGYKNEMDGFVKTNPGLFRRIAYRMEFPDYSCLDIAKIVNIKIMKSEYEFEEGLDVEEIKEQIEKCTSQELRSKTNGGLAEKLVQYSIDELNSSIDLDSKGKQLITLKKEHVVQALKRNFENKII